MSLDVSSAGRNRPERFRRYLPFVAIAALLLVFGILADEVVEGSTLAFDRGVLMLFRNAADSSQPIGPIWLQETMRDLTSLGSTIALALLTVAVVVQLLLSGERKTALYVAVSVASGSAVSSILKLLFDRPRPDIPGAPHVFTASFPSGHAALSAVVFLTLAALLSAATPLRRLKVFYLGLGIFLSFVIGLSRIYLGLHYPTDVVAGWLIGAAWAMLCWVGAHLLLGIGNGRAKN